MLNTCACLFLQITQKWITDTWMCICTSHQGSSPLWTTFSIRLDSAFASCSLNHKQLTEPHWHWRWWRFNDSVSHFVNCFVDEPMTHVKVMHSTLEIVTMNLNSLSELWTYFKRLSDIHSTWIPPNSRSFIHNGWIYSQMAKVFIAHRWYLITPNVMSYEFAF